MTEAPSGSHGANQSVPAVPSPAQHSLSNGYAQTPTPDEEPYTIKCVCNFEDDDGSTVFCDYCETWQHIDCYYPNGTVPEIHTCVGCSQGQVQVDVPRAIELQMRRREKGTVSDRRPRRTTAKSHKRKPRESVQLDGPNNAATANNKQADRRTGAGRDNAPPQKKARTGHKVNMSTASQADKRAAPGRRRVMVPSNLGAASSPDSASDVHSPCAVEPQNPFSAEFMRLQDDDPGDSNLQANLFSNIAIPGILANWIYDADALRVVTNGHAPGDVFQRVDGAFELLPFPEVVKRTKQDQSVEYGGRHPTWQYVAVNDFVPNGGLVGEIKGQVGHLNDYCANPSNRWQYLLHPEPFVFFHPYLPIYIDTRREGTRCR